MYDHIGLKVKNIGAAVRFYEAALASLGHALCSRDETGAGLGPAGAPALWLHLHKGSPGPGVHVALRAADRAAVDRFHAEGLQVWRPRSRRSRIAHRLQSQLLRGVPARSGWEQCRGGVHAVIGPRDERGASAGPGFHEALVCFRPKETATTAAPEPSSWADHLDEPDARLCSSNGADRVRRTCENTSRTLEPISESPTHASASRRASKCRIG